MFCCDAFQVVNCGSSAGPYSSRGARCSDSGNGTDVFTRIPSAGRECPPLMRRTYSLTMVFAQFEIPEEIATKIFPRVHE